MANEEQLAILKQGVDVWNRWRDRNRSVYIDLDVDFIELDLQSINFENANLDGVDFTKANLEGASFYRAQLTEANFTASNLKKTNFTDARLVLTNFYQANLESSNLEGANLDSANLTNANLSYAYLGYAYFLDTNLAITDFTNAIMRKATFGNNDLRTTIGLQAIRHEDSSSLGIDTIQKSKGKIPIEFLRGCGLPDLDIEYAKLANPELSNEEISEITQNIFDLKSDRPIQISPLFISYSHANMSFVEKLEAKLIEKGIRFWRDVHNATAGRLERQINRAIRHNPTVLLILSENSTKSDWVEHEVRLARKLEKEMGRDVLCPIALDDSWKTSKWPERIMEQVTEYNILDFSKWDDDTKFDEMFTKLIDGLDMFYRG